MRVDTNGTLDIRAPGGETIAELTVSLISGGRLFLPGTRTIHVPNGLVELDATITSIIPGNATQGLTKTGQGTLTLTGDNPYDNPYGGATTITSGRLNVNGRQPASPVVVGGILSRGEASRGGSASAAAAAR